MESNQRDVPSSVFEAVAAAGIITFLVLASHYFVAKEGFGAGTVWFFISQFVVVTIGVAILIGVLQLRHCRMQELVGDHGAAIKGRNVTIEHLRHDRERLLEEIDERKRCEGIDMQIDEKCEEAIDALVSVVAALYNLRREGKFTHAELGKVQDDALIALLVYLEQRIPLDAERFRGHPASVGAACWDTEALDQFFRGRKKQLQGALVELSAQRNKEYMEAVFALPPQVALYVMRLTLVNPAQQAAARPV